jgi:hypothetical protein
MADKVPQLSKDVDDVFVEIIIGNINRGSFEIIVFDDAGNPTLIGRAFNGNGVAHKFKIPKTAKELNKHKLDWNVSFGASTEKPDQNWSVTMLITQNNKIVPDGEIPDRGQFTSFGFMHHKVRLQII